MLIDEQSVYLLFTLLVQLKENDKVSKVEIEQIRLLIQDVKDVFEKKKPQKVDVILQLANDMFMLYQEMFDHGDA